ncbi:MAG: hypothetical protein IJ499_03245 [Clostridia bacterium]|nr:hypothetical protein [Clostridia bacterium]
MLHNDTVCCDCAEKSTAEEESVCSLCSDRIHKGDIALFFEDEVYCSVCIRILEAGKGYI